MVLISGVTVEQGVLLTHNVSERFESRFTTVRIDESPAVMLQGMAGSTLGIWVAHGEGKISSSIHGQLYQKLSRLCT